MAEFAGEPAAYSATSSAPTQPAWPLPPRTPLADEASFAPLDELEAAMAARGVGTRCEGHCTPRQARWLRDEVERLVDLHARPMRCLEVGFNKGHSACAMLAARGGSAVDSFDLGEHGAVASAAEYVASRWPGRHRLTLGDSVRTLGALVSCEESPGYDLVFVDGGHSLEVARSDLANGKALARPGATVVMDDIAPEYYWGLGPARAWRDACDAGWITHSTLYEIPDAEPKRRWAVGHYSEPPAVTADPPTPLAS